MTNNSSERLDRLEAILETTIQGLAETRKLTESNSRDLAATRKIVESNGKAIQAMLDQRASDQLKHEQQLEEQRKINQKLTNYIEGLANMFARFDEERPTILRKLTTIENKLDSLQTIETKLDRIIER